MAPSPRRTVGREMRRVVIGSVLDSPARFILTATVSINSGRCGDMNKHGVRGRCARRSGKWSARQLSSDCYFLGRPQRAQPHKTTLNLHACSSETEPRHVICSQPDVCNVGRALAL